MEQFPRKQTERKSNREREVILPHYKSITARSQSNPSDITKGVVIYRARPGRPEVEQLVLLCFPWFPDLGPHTPASTQQAETTQQAEI